MNSISLSALRTIEAIARGGTLAQAAKELGVTPGALSQRLAKAEAALGQPMFHRSAAGLKPTEVCAELSPRLTLAFSDLSAIVTDLRDVDSSALTVSVAPIFASRWLIWRIQEFNVQNPKISVRVVPTVEMVDLNTSDVDVGIRVGEDPALGAGAIKLLDQRVFPVCSPEIAIWVKTSEDLTEIPVIRENEGLYGWKPWFADRGMSMPKLTAGPTYADASLCLDAAMTGQGIFMAWETLACDALERGQIASPFTQRSLTGATYWFATSRSSPRKKNIRAFQLWLKDELECSVKHWEQSNR